MGEATIGFLDFKFFAADIKATEDAGSSLGTWNNDFGMETLALKFVVSYQRNRECVGTHNGFTYEKYNGSVSICWLTVKESLTRHCPDCSPTLLMTDNWGVVLLTWGVGTETHAIGAGASAVVEGGMLVAGGEDWVRGCSGAGSVGTGGGSCVVGGHSGTGSVGTDGGHGGSCVVEGHSGTVSVGAGKASCGVGGHSGASSVSTGEASCGIGGHSGSVSASEASCRIVLGMLVSVVVGRMGVGPAGASLSKSITCTPGGGAFVFTFFHLWSLFPLSSLVLHLEGQAPWMKGH